MLAIVQDHAWPVDVKEGNLSRSDLTGCLPDSVFLPPGHETFMGQRRRKARRNFKGNGLER